MAELFDFMRDAERRFATLRMRIVERTWTSRGEDLMTMDTVLRHPGDARVTTTPAGRRRAGRVRDLDHGRRPRPDLLERPQLGTQRPIRNRPRGLDDPDFPGTSMVYEPVTPLPAETLPDTFIHPAGFCQNVLSTGPLHGDRHGPRRRPRGDPPRVRPPAHDRAGRRSARLPHLDSAVDRETGVIVRLVETIGGDVTRHAEVIELAPDAPLPPTAFDFVFPTGTTMLY